MTETPTIIVPTPDQVLAVARHPHDLADGFRTMQDTLGLSDKWINDAGDFGDGYIGKYLGPSRIKQIGPWTFQMLCSLLAVEWRMHVDIERAKVMAGQWEARNPQYVQPKSRAPSQQIIDRAREHVLKDFSRLGNEARKLLLPREQRVKIAHKAAKARARLPKAQRSTISRKGWETRRVRNQQRSKKEDQGSMAETIRGSDKGKGIANGGADPD